MTNNQFLTDDSCANDPADEYRTTYGAELGLQHEHVQNESSLGTRT